MMITATRHRTFYAAIEAAGLVPPKHFIPDGKIHRFASNGEQGDDAGWYVLYDDHCPAGAFGCWRTGARENWAGQNGRPLSAQEHEHQRHRVETIQRQREEEDQRRHSEAALEARRIWE